MATINLIEESTAAPQIKEVYEDVKQHFNLDFVPSVFKAMAHQGPEVLKQAWDGLKQAEDFWGKETLYTVSLAIDIMNNCSYCINFDTAVLKTQLGYDDAKIEGLVNFIATNSLYNSYVTGLQLAPDVTPDTMARMKAA